MADTPDVTTPPEEQDVKVQPNPAEITTFTPSECCALERSRAVLDRFDLEYRLAGEDHDRAAEELAELELEARKKKRELQDRMAARQATAEKAAQRVQVARTRYARDAQDALLAHDVDTSSLPRYRFEFDPQGSLVRAYDQSQASR
jgi:hypothetical protein